MSKKDRRRPFSVVAGVMETRVLGTVFSVAYKPQGLRIAVKEGKVQVGKKPHMNSTNSPQVLLAGQRVSTKTDGGIGTVEKIDPNTVGTWREGRLVYENATLKELVSDANRYHNELILLYDKKTADMQVSIAFKTDNIDHMIENIAEILTLEINRDVPGRIVLRAK